MAKILCVLYDDPVTGNPREMIRDDIPQLSRYPDGQTLPTPSKIDFTPGQLLGSVSGELGLRKFLEEAGHEFVVTSDRAIWFGSKWNRDSESTPFRTFPILNYGP